MSKKLKLKFWIANEALAFQVIEQRGLPRYRDFGNVRITNGQFLEKYKIGLWGDEQDTRTFRAIPSYFYEDNEERDRALLHYIRSISEELFSKERPREIRNGETLTLIWKSY